MPFVPSAANAAPGAPAARANYYVDSVHGADSNSGTSPGSPWRSLNNVNGRSFGPGEVINLARGSNWTGAGADSATLTFNGGGAQDAPVTVQAYGSGLAPALANPGEGDSVAVRVQAAWVIVQDLLVQDAHLAGILLSGGADHAVVQKNEAQRVGTLVQVESHYNKIIGNYAHDLTMVVNDGAPDNDYGATGVLVHASDNEVAYNRLSNCRASSADYGMDGDGVELFGTVNNTSIHHNYIENTAGFVEIGGGQAHAIKIAYNVIVNSGAVLGLHAGANFGSDIAGVQFTNNTDVDRGPGYALFYVDGGLADPSALTMRNNIFQVNNYGALAQNPACFTHDHNLYFFGGSQPNLNYPFGPGERVADPRLRNPAGGDFRLQAGSPAIDGGTAPDFASDPDGVPVPTGSAPDIGAYEFGGEK